MSVCAILVVERKDDMKNGFTPETKEEFITLLNTYNIIVERTLAVLFANQTLEERHSEHTIENNGVGFTGIDGEILSSFSRQMIEKEGRGVPAGHRLTPGQLAVCRKVGASGVHKLGKYWKQIQAAIAAKEAAKANAAGSFENNMGVAA